MYEAAGGGGGGATAERGTREGRMQESWMLRSEPSGGSGGDMQERSK